MKTGFRKAHKSIQTPLPSGFLWFINGFIWVFQNFYYFFQDKRLELIVNQWNLAWTENLNRYIKEFVDIPLKRTLNWILLHMDLWHLQNECKDNIKFISLTTPDTLLRVPGLGSTNSPPTRLSGVTDNFFYVLESKQINCWYNIGIITLCCRA